MPFLIIVIAIIVIIAVTKSINEKKYRELEAEVFKKLGFSNWNIVSYIDENVTVKSRQTLEKYDDIKFFKENKEKLVRAQRIIKRKNEVANILSAFLNNNEYKDNSQYNRLANQINAVIKNAMAYRICVTYISSAGNNLGSREIALSKYDIDKFDRDPALLMGKGEYNKYLKEQEKGALVQKQHNYYERVNNVIDYANDNRNLLFIKGGVEQLDNLIAQLFDRTVNSIKKIKDINSEEWDIINNFITRIEQEIKKIVGKNQRILDYYESPAFLKIKETCEVLMSTQREFNEYIAEKVKSISQLFWNESHSKRND